MQPTVLIAVLNWGLGHATRSIPIINAYLKKNYIVHIASDGDALLFLKKEYPDLVFHMLPGYNVTYPYKSILLNVITSSLPILKAIRKEKVRIQEIVSEIKPSLIISDNRYGVRSKSIKSVIITHQLNIQLNNKLFSFLATLFIKFLIRRFNEVWIPDFKGEKSLSGVLSLSTNDDKYVYLGPLSRFKKEKSSYIYDIAFVLSGPEPQRTTFEKIIFISLENTDKKVIVIRGKVDGSNNSYLNDNLEIKDYLLSEELNKVLNQSKCVIARSGYSTIMDLAVLGKNAILIPTPGQTEQEYLAEYLTKKKIYFTMHQDDFDLQIALESCKIYNGVIIENDSLDSIISKI